MPGMTAASRTLMALPVLFALLAGVSATPASAVVGGTKTEPGRGTFVVALVDSREGRKTVAAGQFCAATAVRRDVIITAAHCVMDEDGIRAAPSDFRIFAGKVMPLRRGRLLRPKSILIHPSFNDGAGAVNADVAVIRLRAPLRDITPIGLAGPADAEASAPGAPLGLWGWGNRSTMGDNAPRQLHDGIVHRYSDARCDELYGRLFNAASQLCAGRTDGSVDACDGDSGGPLTATGANGRAVLIGVVSFGEGCGRPDFPTVYTKLFRYRTFLARALAPRR